MRKPHKHAEVIHAFADGAEIQYQNPCGKVWRDIKEPSFLDNFNYRVKPEPKMAWYRVAEVVGGSSRIAVSDSDIKALVNSKYFIRWLTDRIEYEVTE